MSKILERVLIFRINHHLNKNKTLHENQYGFREGRNTLQCINRLTSEIDSRSKTSKYSSVVFFDIVGAFDNADWSLIINNLTNYNIPPYLLLILKSYLANRSVGYEFNNTIKIKQVYKGCPQGSCLGPLLWNLLINPIFDAFNSSFPNSSLLAFADDFAMISSANSRRDLESITNSTTTFFNNYCNSLNLQVSTEKTVAMCFGGNLSKRWPSFKLMNQNIKILTKHKYLGVIIDHKLNFLPHLDYLRTQILQFNSKSHQVNFNYWGVRKSFLKTWYNSVILSKILYGSLILYPRLNCKGITKLISINRIFLIKLTNAYRKTSNAALNIISGIPPITDIINKFLTKFSLKFLNTEISIQSIILTKDDLDYKPYKNDCDTSISLQNLSFSPYQKTQSNPALFNSFKIYTDGSKNDLTSGFGIHAHHNSDIIYSLPVQLRPQNSVFQAEAAAIDYALKWTLSKLTQPTIPTYLNNPILICSDSQSVLYSIANLFPSSHIIKSIKNTLHEINSLNPTIKFILSWVRGHSGDAGNERADELAKKSLTNPDLNINNLKIPPSYVTSYLQNILISNWQSSWDSAPQGRFTFNLIPTVNTNLDEAHQVLTYFLTGHGAFPTYLYKIGKSPTNQCSCGELGDPLHFISHSCSFSPLKIIKSNAESYTNYFLRITKSKHLTNLAIKIYNHLNLHFSFIKYQYQLL